jgi:hypothetical protein
LASLSIFVPAIDVGASQLCTSGGAGTLGNPYLVCTATDLQNITTSNHSYFVLGADRDLTGINWSSNDFYGTLDGNGHKITNFNFSTSSGYSGFVNWLEPFGVIKNVAFTNVSITVQGAPYVGPVAGLVQGTISNVAVTGELRTDSVYSGGFVGLLAGGSILNVESSVNIVASGSQIYEAGIVPVILSINSSSSITNAIYLGAISGASNPIGISFEPLGSNGPLDCSSVVNSYSLSPINGCGTQLSQLQMSNLGAASSQFANYPSAFWSFAAGQYPYLTSFGNLTPRPYSVVYSSGGGAGNVPTQSAIAQGATFSVAANSLTYLGYNFAGWTDGTNTFQPGSTYTMGSSPVTLTAVWVTPPIVYSKPTAPSNVTASISNGTATVSFTPGSSGNLPTYNQIDMLINGQSVGNVCNVTGATSCPIANLGPDAAFSFTVTAINSKGSATSSVSNVVSYASPTTVAPTTTTTTTTMPLAKQTITCVKGKITKKVTAVSPVCPGGYKKK